MARPLSSSLLAGALAWLACAVHAAPHEAASSGASARTEHVTVALLPSVERVRPGERLTIGLRQQIIPHWHTYWLNPGDSGVATTIAWHLPEGSQAGDIQWPAPQRIDVGPVTNYGYADEVTLLSDITLPATLTPGDKVDLRADVSWLVCEKTCIPEKATLRLSLPVVAAGTAPQPSLAHIEQARSSLPRPAPWRVTAERQGEALALHLPREAMHAEATPHTKVAFFPADWGVIQHSALQKLDVGQVGARLSLKTGEAAPAHGQVIKGLLVLTQETAGQARPSAYWIEPTVSMVTGPVDMSAATQPAAEDASWLLAVAFGFLGGLILNLMPCVFPVLSIKALSLLQHSAQSRRSARLQGLSYTAGVLLSFVLLALALLALKAGGSQVGWGFQFQSPGFVLIMAHLMLLVGLNLSGVFEWGGALSNVGGGLAGREGLIGSFFTGVLATIVATPCTAPFMGSAIGFALGQPTPVVLAVFLSLGLGLATPYLLLSWWPALQARLPRPGAWMQYLKELLAFPMYATAAWLVWVLAQQAGTQAVASALLGMVLTAWAAWLFGRTRATTSKRFKHAGSAAAALALAAAMGLGQAGLSLVIEDARAGTTDAERHWEPYSAARLSALQQQGEPVFVNMTAAWCITCLANERVALSQPEVREAFKARGITYLKGDWTRQDPAITALLARFGRSGVPLYVYYPAGRGQEPIVLPQLLTTDIVLSTLAQAEAGSKVSSTHAPHHKEPRS